MTLEKFNGSVKKISWTGCKSKMSGGTLNNGILEQKLKNFWITWKKLIDLKNGAQSQKKYKKDIKTDSKVGG